MAFIVSDETLCVAGFLHIWSDEDPGLEEEVGYEVSWQEFVEGVETQAQGEQDGEQEAAPHTLHLHLHLLHLPL